MIEVILLALATGLRLKTSSLVQIYTACACMTSTKHAVADTSQHA